MSARSPYTLFVLANRKRRRRAPRWRMRLEQERTSRAGLLRSPAIGVGQADVVTATCAARWKIARAPVAACVQLVGESPQPSADVEPR